MDARALLEDLVRLDTTNPPGSEEAAAELLESELSAAGLQTRLYRSPGGRTSLVARLEGPRGAPALVLVSHTDVVAAEEDAWSHDPFGAEEAGGCIWGRGTLDMKGVLAMHAAAAAALAGRALRREVIVCAFADEEAGGREGAAFLLERYPEELGFGDGRPAPEVIGEGGFGVSGVLGARAVVPVVLGEKQALWLEVTARGEPGHGSQPPARQAALELARFVTAECGYGPARLHPVMRRQFALMAAATGGVRKAFFRALASGAGNAVARAAAGKLRTTPLGRALADTVTLTTLRAGYKHNVVPGEATAALDCRLLPDSDARAFATALQERYQGRGITVEIAELHGGALMSGEGELYRIMCEVSAELPGAPLPLPSITPAMTDVRFFRARGAQGYGWVPLVLTPELLATIHGHDERIPVDGFHHALKATTRVLERAALEVRR